MTAPPATRRRRVKAEALPPAGVHIGPDDYPEDNRTLGWAAIEWALTHLKQPDGPDADKPWNFTIEQVRWLLNFYAIDERGRFLYRYAVLRRMKGWGKDPMAAVVAAIEFLGPCRFGGWNADGSPKVIDVPSAWIQVAAVSKDQTTNTMSLFPGLFTEQCLALYQVDLGKEIIYAFHGRRRIQAVTSSPRALEGGRATFVIKNENQHWLKPNEGHGMAAVISRNLAKARDGSARALAICNAYAPGEDSDAQHDWEAYAKQPHGILYDSVEAGPEAIQALSRLREGEARPGDKETVLAALEWCRGDSVWLDIERKYDEVMDPRIPLNTSSRYEFNVPAASEERAFNPADWAKLSAPKQVADGALITLGFDGSTSSDHTALIGTEVETGYQFVVGYWEPRVDIDGNLRVREEEVDAAVLEAFEKWSVWRMYADPFYWEGWLSQWAGRHGKDRVVEFRTNSLKRMAVTLLAYDNAIKMGELSHDGDRRFAACIANAFRHEQAFLDDNGERMWTIEKERPDSPFKIDAAMAGCLSWQARLDAVAAGAEPEHGWVIR